MNKKILGIISYIFSGLALVCSLSMLFVFNIHDYDSGKKIRDPGCVSGGLMEYTCILCGEKKYEEIHAPGHNWGPFTSNNDATHYSDGTKSCTCLKCGKVTRADDKGTKIPHTFDQQVIDDKYLAVAATIDSPAQYYYSCICGAIGSETFINS